MKMTRSFSFLPMGLAAAGLTACASLLGGNEVKVRPVDTLAALGTSQRDPLYESAVAAINARDYGRALDYLQAAKAKDPRNVRALNALGVVYDKLGRFDLSARYYAQARLVEPDSKIVAENMGYSGVLQRLLNPNQPIAVATIDLPPDLIKTATSATPSPAAEKTAIATAVAPAIPATERTVIDTVPHVVAAAPFTLPEAKQSLASIILPEPAVPVTEKRVIDAPAPILAATRFVLPDTRPIFAAVFFSDPVITERKIIDTPRAAAMATPLALSQEKPFFATAVLPELAVPVTEKRVIDASPRTFAPFVLPDVKPLFATSLSSQAVVAAENSVSREAAPSAVAGPAPAKLVIVPTAPVPPSVRARMVSAPALATAPVVKLVPATLLSSLPVAELVMEKNVVAPLPAVAMAPAQVKPVVVVSQVMPEPKAAAAAVPAVAMSVSPSPAKPVAPIFVTQKKVFPTVAVPPRPAKIAPSPVMAASHVSPASIAAAPSHMQTPKPLANVMAAKMAPNTTNRNGKILIGQPIRLFNASGKAGGTGMVLRRLTTLGWTMRPSEGGVQPVTMLYYSLQNIAAAKALQRTLPFPVRLAANKAKTSGMRLVIGRDYLSWKPRNARLAAQWQKGTTVAFLQKPSIRGVR